MKNFIVAFFPEYLENEAVQKEILRQFARPICGRYTAKITNALFRHGIKSLWDLLEVELDWTGSSMYYINKMKDEIRKRMKG